MYTVRLPKPSLDFSLVAVTFCLDSWSLAPCSLGISKCSGDSHRESLGCLSTVLFSPGAHPSAPPWNPRSPALFLQPLEGVSHSSWFCLSTSVSGGDVRSASGSLHCVFFPSVIWYHQVRGALAVPYCLQIAVLFVFYPDFRIVLG